MNQPTEVREPEAVFVDSTGRRRRFGRALGIMAGCLLLAYIVVIVIGVTAGTKAPFAPWPKAKPSVHTAPRDRSAPARPLGPRSGSPRSGKPVSQRSSVASATSPKPHAAGTAASAPAPKATQATRGRAFGRTKSPNPRKP